MLAQGAAAVADSAARGQCQGPVCALLPVLSAMNLTLSDVQVNVQCGCPFFEGGRGVPGRVGQGRD